MEPTGVARSNRIEPSQPPPRSRARTVDGVELTGVTRAAHQLGRPIGGQITVGGKSLPGGRQIASLRARLNDTPYRSSTSGAGARYPDPR